MMKLGVPRPDFLKRRKLMKPLQDWRQQLPRPLLRQGIYGAISIGSVLLLIQVFRPAPLPVETAPVSATTSTPSVS
jgi:hypothetical protein